MGEELLLCRVTQLESEEVGWLTPRQGKAEQFWKGRICFQALKLHSAVRGYMDYLASHSSWEMLYSLFVLMGAVNISTCEQHPCVTGFLGKKPKRHFPGFLMRQWTSSVTLPVQTVSVFRVWRTFPLIIFYLSSPSFALTLSIAVFWSNHDSHVHYLCRGSELTEGYVHRLSLVSFPECWTLAVFS